MQMSTCGVSAAPTRTAILRAGATARSGRNRRAFRAPLEQWSLQRESPGHRAPKINACKRLIDPERPWLSGLCVNMTPIVKAECHVAVLLDLKDNNTGAQRMNGSGRDEHGVAFPRNDVHKVVRDRPVWRAE